MLDHKHFFFLKFCLVLFESRVVTADWQVHSGEFDDLLKCLPEGLHCTHEDLTMAAKLLGTACCWVFNLNTKTGRPMTDTPT